MPLTDRCYVIAPLLNVRNGPGLDCAVIEQLRAGAQVNVKPGTERGGCLAYVMPDGRLGWVVTRWLTEPTAS